MTWPKLASMQRKPVIGRAVRGRPIRLKQWWLDAAKRKADGHSEQELAVALSATAHRVPPWDRTVVGNFLRNEHTTEEMMMAFSLLYDLPPQVIYPRSYEEADQLWKERRKFDASFDEREARMRASDSETSALELRDKYARAGVSSSNGQKRTSETDASEGGAQRSTGDQRTRRRPRGVGARRGIPKKTGT